MKVAGLGRGLTELASQPGQVHVDGAVAATPRLLPHVGQQLVLGHHLAGPPGQGEDEVELLARQVDAVLAEPDLTAARVDPELTHLDGVVGSCLSGGAPSEYGPDAGLDLRGPEGFDDVVVRTGVEQLDHACVVVAGRSDDDGYVAYGAQHREDVAAIEVRQPEIEDDDVRRVRQRRGQSFCPGLRGGDDMTVGAEVPCEGTADRRIVLDQHDARHTRRVVVGAVSLVAFLARGQPTISPRGVEARP